MLSEREILTKVTHVFIKHRLGLRFTAGIRIMSVVKNTIQTAVQISSAVQASISPANAVLRGDFVPAAKARLHSESP